MQGKSQDGFTLIEMMVTVAVIAIAAGIALPSYTAYMQRSRVPAGLEGLSSFQTRMEQRYQDVGNYANGNACAVAVPTVNNFVVTCALANNGQNFTATATGQGPMNGYTYTVNQSGSRSTPAHPKGANLSCWTLKGTACDS